MVWILNYHTCDFFFFIYLWKVIKHWFVRVSHIKMNILQRLISNNYEFTFHEFFEGKYGAKYCSVCCEVICGPAYIAEEDGGNNMHKSCAELPGKIERPLSHPLHDLTIQYGFNQNPVKVMICDGCSQVSLGLKFRCKICSEEWLRDKKEINVNCNIFHVSYFSHSVSC